MSVLLFSLSHQNTPVDILERFVFAHEVQEKIIIDLQRSPLIFEVMVLTTCNRMEIYAVVEAFHPALASISQILSDFSDVPLATISEYAQVKYAHAAIRHIFSLACGLESALVGEQQISGQLRAAYQQGQRLHTIGAVLHDLIQDSLRVGKKIRTATGLDRAGVSLVSIAMDQAYLALIKSPCNAVVIGAGAMGSLAVTHLARKNVPDIVIINRTVENAQQLAYREAKNSVSHISVVRFSQIVDAIAAADLVISCTGAIGVVLDDNIFAQAMKLRCSTRAIPVFVDLSLPADISIVHQPDLCVITLAELITRARDDSYKVHDLILHAEAMITAELDYYHKKQISKDIVPTVTALREYAADIVNQEWHRLDMKLSGLDNKERQEIERSIHRIVDKLLHVPTMRIKELATMTDGAHYAKALQELFSLSPGIAETLFTAPQSRSCPWETNQLGNREQ